MAKDRVVDEALNIMKTYRTSIANTLAAMLVAAGLGLPPAAHALSDSEAIAVQKATPKDTSGKKRKGKASYYHQRFAGKKMADGTRMDPQSNNAASKTLPLGTRAKVTNLANGKTAVVEIRDRGPYVAGRIVDVSPKTARQLGMKEDGVAPVEVAPIAVPLPDGSVKRGVAAADSDQAVSFR